MSSLFTSSMLFFIILWVNVPVNAISVISRRYAALAHITMQPIYFAVLDVFSGCTVFVACLKLSNYLFFFLFTYLFRRFGGGYHLFTNTFRSPKILKQLSSRRKTAEPQKENVYFLTCSPACGKRNSGLNTALYIVAFNQCSDAIFIFLMYLLKTL